MIIKTAVTENGLLELQSFLLSEENMLSAMDFPGVFELRLCTTKAEQSEKECFSEYITDEGKSVKLIKLIRAERFGYGESLTKNGYAVTLEISQTLHGRTGECWGDGEERFPVSGKFISKFFEVIGKILKDHFPELST